ncbi:MAG: acylneuraminate cytidylyltransferase family protein [Halomonadaceae bacterium]|jgi:CMP-N-acetylneuraminic acid synthetase
MKNFAFIFARGGSKGLPGKNIKPLSGKPLLQYSIDVALAAPSIDQVFVSTEDEDIASIASRGGAIVIERPHELATDASPEWLSWKHATTWVQKNHGAFDCFISLPATSPLRSIADVENAISKRLQQKADVCIAVTPSTRSPFFNMVTVSSTGHVRLVNSSEQKITRRQDAPEIFDITTSVYVTTPNYILNSDGLFFGVVTSIEVPKSRAIDIDDIYDFRLAEAILKSEGI